MRPYGLQPARLLYPWDSQGRNTGEGCHALFQGIFPAQGSNPHLMSPALAGEFFTTSTTWETQTCSQTEVLLLITKKQTSQVNNFSALLCMERRESWGLLKLFFWYAL